MRTTRRGQRRGEDLQEELSQALFRLYSDISCNMRIIMSFLVMKEKLSVENI